VRHTLRLLPRTQNVLQDLAFDSRQSAIWKATMTVVCRSPSGINEGVMVSEKQMNTCMDRQMNIAWPRGAQLGCFRQTGQTLGP
jgi:hypothetical protein